MLTNWHTLLEIVLRTTVVYVLVLLGIRLTGKRDQDLELEVRHARLSLQLGVEGCRQQGEGPDQLKPSAPLTMVQRAERPGWQGARISSWNKLTLQVLTRVAT